MKISILLPKTQVLQYLTNYVSILSGHILPTSDSDNKLVSLSGMAETPRLQAKQVLRCRQATCHSGHRAGIQEIRFLDFWMPDRVRHDKKQLISNQPDMEPLVL